VEGFLAIEASSGIVLMVAAIAALLWANSPWRDTYSALWHIRIGYRLGEFGFDRDLHFWINEGLMTIFFFVVGLEIRREIHGGELSEVRRAALPLALFNAGRPSSVGWAIPMATDIAFAVGVLALLGKRVSPALRILLLALAVIDDVGAILVIALFYSTGVALSGFGILAAGIGVTFLMQKFGIRSPVFYVAPAAVIWYGAYVAGIHPTLAGVVVGLMTPAKAWPGRESVSPVEYLEHLLHGWVAYGVIPLFAFANAGVSLGEVSFSTDSWAIVVGVVMGLLIGKPAGIVGFAWLAVRAGAAKLPVGVRWSHVLVVGLAGGIGFTMSLFIAHLAFPSGAALELAKLSILCGSVAAGVFSLVAGHRILKVEEKPGAAASAAEAEASTSG
jgi:NhaA family Na+:H+ antiporter